MDMTQIEYCIMQNCSTEQLGMVIKAVEVENNQGLIFIGIGVILLIGCLYFVHKIM